jgi:hypothetical protein
MMTTTHPSDDRQRTLNNTRNCRDERGADYRGSWWQITFSIFGNGSG